MWNSSRCFTVILTLSFFVFYTQCRVIVILRQCEWLCVFQSNFRTFAALRLIAQPIISLLAALTALSLHIDFAAALASNQTSPDVCHAITYSSILGAQWVAVTGCRNTVRGSWRGFGTGFLHLDVHLLTQSGSGNTFHTETHALSSSASTIGPALLDMGQEGYFEFLCRKLNHISPGTEASDCLNLRHASVFIKQLWDMTQRQKHLMKAFPLRN